MNEFWYENTDITYYESEVAVPDFAFCIGTEDADIAFFYFYPMPGQWKTFAFRYFGGTKVTVSYRQEGNTLYFRCHLPAEQIPPDFTKEEIEENTYFRVSFWFGNEEEIRANRTPPFFTEKYSIWQTYEKEFEVYLPSKTVFGFYTCNWQEE
jgi:hypothetical protein